jgi:hypothetical protein
VLHRTHANVHPIGQVLNVRIQSALRDSLNHIQTMNLYISISTGSNIARVIELDGAMKRTHLNVDRIN